MEELYNFFKTKGYNYWKRFVNNEPDPVTGLYIYTPEFIQREFRNFSGIELSLSDVIRFSHRIESRMESIQPESTVTATHSKEKLLEFFKDRGYGYWYRFMHSLPEPSGQMVLTPLYVQDDYRKFSGIEIDVNSLLSKSSVLQGEMDKFNAEQIQKEQEEQARIAEELRIKRENQEREEEEKRLQAEAEKQRIEAEEKAKEVVFDPIPDEKIEQFAISVPDLEFVPEPIPEDPVEETKAEIEPIEAEMPGEKSIVKKIVQKVKNAVKSKPKGKSKPKNKKKK